MKIQRNQAKKDDEKNPSLVCFKTGSTYFFSLKQKEFKEQGKGWVQKYKLASHVSSLIREPMVTQTVFGGKKKDIRSEKTH